MSIEIEIVKDLKSIEYIETTIDGVPIRIEKESSNEIPLAVVISLGAIIIFAIIVLILVTLKKKGGGRSASMRRS